VRPLEQTGAKAFPPIVIRCPPEQHRDAVDGWLRRQTRHHPEAYPFHPVTGMSRSKQRLQVVDGDSDTPDQGERPIPEDPVDRFGLRTALIVIAAGLLMAALWKGSRSSLEDCFRLEDLSQRYACYDAMRTSLSRPAIGKGAEAPAMANRLQ
jgi:hypothetical protein